VPADTGFWNENKSGIQNDSMGKVYAYSMKRKHLLVYAKFSKKTSDKPPATSDQQQATSNKKENRQNYKGIP